ncbi:uncharacterized protein LOC144866345 [Branchiostoma floridae x Branchiostoma japonicum]
MGKVMLMWKAKPCREDAFAKNSRKVVQRWAVRVDISSRRTGSSSRYGLVNLCTGRRRLFSEELVLGPGEREMLYRDGETDNPQRGGRDDTADRRWGIVPPHIVQHTHRHVSSTCTDMRRCDSKQSLQHRCDKRGSGRRDGLYTHSGVPTPHSTQPADSVLFRTGILLRDAPGPSSRRILHPKPA